MTILFCGGSHLAHFYKFLKNELKAIDCKFLVTGGSYQFWSRDGNRFKVDGTVISNLYRQERSFKVDLSDFDRIIFVGQILQPHRVFWGRQPLSKALVKDVLDLQTFPLHMRSFGKDDQFDSPTNPWFFNEPLHLFPKLAVGKCVSIDDPLPRHLLFESVPIHAKRSFLKAVGDFCRLNNIQRVPQRQETISENLITLDEYAFPVQDDFTHANEKYWRIVWKDLTSMKCLDPIKIK